MEKHRGTLADRPRMIAARKMLAGGLGFGFAPAGDRLRRMRRSVICDTIQIGFQRDAGYYIHTHLQPKTTEAYQPLQMSHAKHTVLDILDDPHNFQNHTIT